MLDFGALPPEINSGRMYTGPGAASVLAAAAGWDAVAAELFCTATGYGSVLSQLTDGWRGPASLAMAKAAAPFVAWLHGAAAVAEQTAAQAKAAAAAYELAFAMTVPPPEVAANRSLLLTLVATNFFGQNTPAIAATEAHYAAMWIQDATAMYSYGVSSAAAGRLTPFTEPRSTADPARPATKSPTWVDYLEHVPNVVNTVIANSSAAVARSGIVITNARLAFQQDHETGPAHGFGSRLVSTVSGGLGAAAAMGRAASIGSLSAPPNWTTAADIRPAALIVPSSAVGTLPAAVPDMAPVSGSVFGQSALGTLSRRGFDEPHPKTKPVIVRSPAAG